MKPRSAACALAALIASYGCVEPKAHASPPAWTPSRDSWRDDPVWRDGLAEKCVYQARRTIYELPRDHVAVAYTNKEHYDPHTTTKSERGGVEVFKHHWSERIPTEKYDYDFSTSIYARADTLAAIKLTVGTQEDCGASFKQAWREGSALAWLDSVYFPGTGLRQGRIEPAENAHFADALPLLLRDYPFDAPRELELALVPSQKSTRQVSFEPVRATVAYVARESLELPIGPLEAHHVTVRGRSIAQDLWFHADAGAPYLHALVRFRDDAGTSYELASIERTAYWQR
jgi:hypothetical protein